MAKRLPPFHRVRLGPTRDLYLFWLLVVQQCAAAAALCVRGCALAAAASWRSIRGAVGCCVRGCALAAVENLVDSNLQCQTCHHQQRRKDSPEARLSKYESALPFFVQCCRSRITPEMVPTNPSKISGKHLEKSTTRLQTLPGVAEALILFARSIQILQRIAKNSQDT